MKKAVIFDLDGTLADTLESISYCTNKALADFGFPAIEKQSYRRFVGNGAKMLIIRALRADGDQENSLRAEPDEDGFVTRPIHFTEVYERYMEYFEKDCMYKVAPYAGIRELLAALKERKIAAAVFSNKPHANAVNVVETLFGEGCFTLIQGQEEGLAIKPAPDGVFAILKKLELNKEEILYVGDSCVDMDTGKAAGVETIGVLWGFRDREELMEHGADALIEKPMDLLKRLSMSGKGQKEMIFGEQER